MSVPNAAAQTSLFVGNLDSRVYRELLTEIFSLAGPVAQCHIVFDKATGLSSGFGFIDYADHETAQAAMEKFRGRTIYGKMLTIDWARATGGDAATGQHCLFVGNLSPDVTDEQLAAAFAQFGSVTSAKCAKDPATGKTQGFAFVNFKEKPDAESAMESMNGQVLNNRALRVDWAKGKTGEENRVPYEVILGQTSINNVTAYVSGLSVTTSENAIRAVFEQYGPIREIRIPESVKSQASEIIYAFVRYMEHASAARAVFECQGGAEVDGRQVQVHWGKENMRRAPAGGRGQSGYYHGGFQQGYQQGNAGDFHGRGGGYQHGYGGRGHQQPYHNQRPGFGGRSHGRPGPPGYQYPHQQQRYRPY